MRCCKVFSPLVLFFQAKEMRPVIFLTFTEQEAQLSIFPLIPTQSDKLNQQSKFPTALNGSFRSFTLFFTTRY